MSSYGAFMALKCGIIKHESHPVAGKKSPAMQGIQIKKRYRMCHVGDDEHNDDVDA